MNFLAMAFLGVFLIFIDINLGWTQKIYSNNRFGLLLFVAIILPAILYFTTTEPTNLKLFLFGLCIFYYLLILWAIKRTYKKMNDLLINKKFLDKEFSDKDFTYVLWDSDIPIVGNWYDKELATKPSWFDYLLSLLLLLLPILICLIGLSLI